MNRAAFISHFTDCLRAWAAAGLVLGCNASPVATHEYAQPASQAPERALQALATYGASTSADAWKAAAQDFSAAAERADAPVRWRAAAHFALAQVALRQGAAERARSELQQSVALDPSWALPHVALSELDCATAPPRALDEAKLAAQLDAELPAAILQLAAAYVCTGDLPLAIEQYRRALARAPQSAALKAELALALHAMGGRYDLEADRLAHEALQQAPDNVQAHLVLAERALDEGASSRALEHAEAASELLPRLPAVQLAKGDAFQQLNNMAPAEAAWRAAIALTRQLGPLGAPPYRLEEVSSALGRRAVPPPRALSRWPSLRSRPAHSSLQPAADANDGI